MPISINSILDIGARQYQEDQIVTQIFNQGRFKIAAVLDGHGGIKCSSFLKQNLIPAIQRHAPSNTVALSKANIEAALQWLQTRWIK